MSASLATSLVRNALFGSGARVITLAVGLVITPYLIHRLGMERFGIWALVSVLTGAMGLLDFSFKNAFVKHLAETVATGKRKAHAQILSTGLASYLVFAAVAVLLFLVIADLVLGLLNIPAPLQSEALTVFWIGLAGFLVGSVMAIFPAVCDARQRMDITNSLGVVALLFGTALIVLAVESGHGLVGVAWAQLAGIVLFHLLCVIAARRLAGPLQIRPAHVCGESFRRLFAFGWRLHVSSMCMIVNRQLDKLILARWAGLSVVSAYEVAFKAVANMGTLQPYLAAALLPASSQISAAGEHQRLLSIYRRATRYLFLLGTPPFIFLALESQTVITAWLGTPNAMAAMIIICLVPGYLINALSNGMAFVCQGVGQPGIQARQSALQLLLNIILSLTLFHLIGPLGAPIGTSIALAVGAFYFARWFHRYLGMDTWPLLKDSALLPLVGSLAGALCAWLVSGQMPAEDRPDALLKLAVSLSVFTTVYLLVAWVSGQLGRAELQLIRSALGTSGRRE
jgi:O-antigen/teichoic acid export membrane protein